LSRLIAADRLYTRDLVAGLRTMGATSHILQDTAKRRSAVDVRTTRHPGYPFSQQKYNLVQQGFAWMKTIGALRSLRHRGGPLVDSILALSVGVQHRPHAAPSRRGRCVTAGTESPGSRPRRFRGFGLPCCVVNGRGEDIVNAISLTAC
jgi:hypothetical protein